jgi:Flp pilus assembly protein TadG
MALVLPVFLMLVLGMLDLGIAVFRYHLLGQAAREGARQAMVHGSLTTALTRWGPTAWSGTADATPGSAGGHSIVAAVQPFLVGFDLSQVSIQVNWPSGDNQPGDPVHVTVSSPYQPIMTYIFSNTTFNLAGESTMPIAH